MKSSVRLILVCALILFHYAAYSQLSIVPVKHQDGVVQVQDLGNCVISSPEKKAVRIELLCYDIHKGAASTIKLMTKPFIINKGISRINGVNLETDSLASDFNSFFWNSYFINYTTLPQGEYHSVIRFLDLRDSLLFQFEHDIKAQTTGKVNKLTDSLDGYFMWDYGNLGHSSGADLVKAFITFYGVSEKGQYELKSREYTDTFVPQVFSPKDMYEEFHIPYDGLLYFKLSFYYSNVLLGVSSRQSFDNPFIFTKKKESWLSSLSNPLSNEKLEWLSEYNVTPPKKEPSVKFSGNVISESGYSNIWMPFQISPPVYSRITIVPTLTVFNIPLRGMLFLSTENSTVYPVNSYSIGFDTRAFKENHLKRIKQLGELNEQLMENMLDDYKETDKYLKGLENEKSKLGQQLEKYKTPTLNIDTANALPSYDIPEFLPDSLRYLDSIKQVDSTRLLYNELLKKYNKTVFEYEKAKKKQQRIKQFLEKNGDTMLLSTPDSLKPPIAAYVPQYQKVLSGIKSFDAGIVYPQFSDATIKGLPVKGVSASVAYNKIFSTVAVGKTLRVNAPEYTNVTVPPRFERNTLAFKVGYGNQDSNHIYISSVNFKDKNTYIRVDSNTVLGPKQNNIYALGGKYRVLKSFFIEGEFASSNYYDNSYQHTESGTVDISGGTINKFYTLKGTYAINKNSGASLQWKNVGAGYISLGVPFLRRDYKEAEAKAWHSFFKNKVAISAFYKYNIDNVSNLKAYENTINGYGFTLRTKFRKLPNIVISHTPYEMNSEFKPTQYTNPVYIPTVVNRFHLTTANLFYAFTPFKSTVIINLGYLNNTIENTSGQRISQQSFTSNINITLPTGNTSITTAGIYKTLPKVDSLNIRFVESAVSFYLLRKINTSAGISYHQNNPKMYKYGGFIQCGYSMKRFTFGLRAMLNLLQGNWMVGTNKELNMGLTISYNF